MHKHTHAQTHTGTDFVYIYTKWVFAPGGENNNVIFAPGGENTIALFAPDR